MSLSIPIAKLSDHIAALPEQLLHEPELGVVKVTRDGQPVLAILPWEMYTVILETLNLKAAPPPVPHP